MVRQPAEQGVSPLSSTASPVGLVVDCLRPNWGLEIGKKRVQNSPIQKNNFEFTISPCPLSPCLLVSLSPPIPIFPQEYLALPISIFDRDNQSKQVRYALHRQAKA